jgi:hypothetical protein
MFRRKLTSLLLIALVGWVASGAILALHHHDCSAASPAAQDCGTCYLIKIGRTAHVDAPAPLAISTEKVALIIPESDRVAPVLQRQAPASPRAPPTL